MICFVKNAQVYEHFLQSKTQMFDLQNTEDQKKTTEKK